MLLRTASWEDQEDPGKEVNVYVRKMFGKKKPSDPSAEWTKTGSFVHKPSRGWLHSDNSLMEGGVCYAVKVSLYVGYIGSPRF